jgi:hypothetical protein
MSHDKGDPWEYLTVQELTRESLIETFGGNNIAGVRLPGFLSSEQCAGITEHVRAEEEGRSRAYTRIDLDAATPIPSHWEIKHNDDDTEATWYRRYLEKVSVATEARRRLIGDVAERIVDCLQRAAGVPVTPMTKFGMPMFFGMIRKGAPWLHFDWAPFDINEPKVLGQAGLNLYFNNGSAGGDLKVYRRLGMSKGNTASSGKLPIGNYGLPHSLVEGVESSVIPCRTGDLVIAPNRFLHEVTPTQIPADQRLTLSFHLAWMASGHICVFS